MPTDLETLIHQIERLKADWDGLCPLPEDRYAKFWEKLRLEWNYNSNHIEGNTLTYAESELLIKFDQVTGIHTLRELEEMKAHDVAIKLVQHLAKDPRPLTEGEVREINKTLLKEPFFKEAETHDGLRTRKLITPGEYKQQPNHVRTPTGEVFRYAEPIATPQLMEELVGWLRSQTEHRPTTAQIVRIAAILHYRYIRIHPFDDGNGRTARLLVNYLLFRFGYPPIVIKSTEKEEYLRVLRLADAANREVVALGQTVENLEPFTCFLAKAFVWSLELGIKAANGASLEEPDDVDKEIELFVREHESAAVPAPRRNMEMNLRALDESFFVVIKAVAAKLSKLLAVFSAGEVHCAFRSSNRSFGNKITRFDEVDSLAGWCRTTITNLIQKGRQGLPDASWTCQVRFLLKGYSGPAARFFDVEETISLTTEEFEFSLAAGNGRAQKRIVSRYDRPFSSETVDKTASFAAKEILDKIKMELEKNS